MANIKWLAYQHAIWWCQNRISYVKEGAFDHFTAEEEADYIKGIEEVIAMLREVE